MATKTLKKMAGPARKPPATSAVAKVATKRKPPAPKKIATNIQPKSEQGEFLSIDEELAGKIEETEVEEKTTFGEYIKWQRQRLQESHENTRHEIALGLVSYFGGFICAIVVFIFIYGICGSKVDYKFYDRALGTMEHLLSIIIAVVSGALGFYFAKQSKARHD